MGKARRFQGINPIREESKNNANARNANIPHTFDTVPDKTNDKRISPNSYVKPTEGVITGTFALSPPQTLKIVAGILVIDTDVTLGTIQKRTTVNVIPNSGTTATLTNITGGIYETEFLLLIGTSGNTITIQHNAGGNGTILCPQDTDYVLEDDEMAILIQTDNTVGAKVWRILGDAVAGGGGGITWPIRPDNDSIAIVTGTVTVDLTQGSESHVFPIGPITGDVEITFSEPPSVGKSQVFILEITQDGTGGHALTFNDTINGTVPTISQTADAKTLLAATTTDGGSTYWVFRTGNAAAAGGGDNLGNHTATESLMMEGYNVQMDTAGNIKILGDIDGATSQFQVEIGGTTVLRQTSSGLVLQGTAGAGEGGEMWLEGEGIHPTIKYDNFQGVGRVTWDSASDYSFVVRNIGTGGANIQIPTGSLIMPNAGNTILMRGNPVYFDGDDDSYITNTANNVLGIFTNSNNRISISDTEVQLQGGVNLDVNGNDVVLDVNANTYIESDGDDNFKLWVGGTNLMQANNTQITFFDNVSLNNNPLDNFSALNGNTANQTITSDTTELTYNVGTGHIHNFTVNSSAILEINNTELKMYQDINLNSFEIDNLFKINGTNSGDILNNTTGWEYDVDSGDTHQFQVAASVIATINSNGLLMGSGSDIDLAGNDIDNVDTITFDERSTNAPTPGAVTEGTIYFYDNSGTQELRVIFGNGTVKTIETDA